LSHNGEFAVCPLSQTWNEGESCRYEYLFETGAYMAKAKKRQKLGPAKKKKSNRKTRRPIGSQTNQPFEQDSKRRIGGFSGTGEPPLMG
jgi:hypothetical protein